MRSGCAGFSDTPALFVHQLTNELYRGGVGGAFADSLHL